MRERPRTPWRWQLASSWLIALLVLAGLWTAVSLGRVTSAAPAAPNTTRASLAGNFQIELGCAADWIPDCNLTDLTLVGNHVWRGQFLIPDGSWEYKVALNGNWDVSYPGSNVALVTTGPTTVTFYYDDKTNAVMDTGNQNKIPVAAGSFQDELGCANHWDPSCVLSLLTDADENGIYTFENDTLPAGDYEFKIAFNEMWGGDIPASNVPFTIGVLGDQLIISWDSSNDDVTVQVVSSIEDPLVAEVITHPVQSEIFYFLMTDRFENGDPTNDEGASPGGTLTETGYLVDDISFYHGGDIAGLESRLDYLEDLGVTALWLTPIFENKPTQPDGSSSQGIGGAYHGYWTKDFEGIDPHLGTEQEVLDFISAAHARNIKVYFDIVVNHTADYIAYQGGVSSYRNKTDYPYRDENGVAFDDRDYIGGSFPALDPAVSFPYVPIFVNPGDNTAKNPAWLNNPIYYHNRGDSSFAGESSTYGDFFGLDDLFTEHPDVVAGFIDIFTGTIATYGIDGFRLDTVKHVNDEFWQEFVPAVMGYAQANGKPDFFMFGEVFSWNVPELSYYTTQAGVPSVLDFEMQGNARGFAEQGQQTHNLRDYFAKDDYYIDADSNAYQLAGFVSNHDGGIERFGFHLRNTNPSATDGELVSRMELAYALPFFARGFPVIYYGDEQGFTGGGNDKLAREDMFPSQVPQYNANNLIGTNATTADSNFDQTHPLYQTLADYAAVYSAHPALQYGAQIHRYSQASAGIYAFSRIDNGEKREYVVVLNNSTSAASATIPTWSYSTDFTPIYPTGGLSVTTNVTGELAVNVPALSVTIYRADAGLAPSASAPSDPTFNTLTAGQVVVGRVEVGVELAEDIFAEVTFAVSVDGGTTYEVIGTDNNAPYRVFYDVSGYAEGTNLRFKATVKDVCYAAAEYGVSAVSVVVGDGTPVPGGQGYTVIHYHRPGDDYGTPEDNPTDYWGLHIWGDAIVPGQGENDWNNPIPFRGETEFGRFMWLELADASLPVNFIIHTPGGDTVPDTREPGGDRSYVPSVHPQIWIMSGDPTVYTSQAAAQGYVTLRYQRQDGIYYTDPTDYWGLHLWGDAIDPSEVTTWEAPKEPDGVDDFGAYWHVQLDSSNPDAVNQPVQFIVHKPNGGDTSPGGTQEPGGDREFIPRDHASVWLMEQDEAVYTQRGAAEKVITIHYRRDAGDYGDYGSSNHNDFWGLHTWGDADEPDWEDPRKPVYTDTFGVSFEVPLIGEQEQIGYIFHKGPDKDPGPDQFLNVLTYGYEVWQLEGADVEYPYVLPILVRGLGNLSQQRAYWLAEDVIAWEAADNASLTYTLHYTPNGGLQATAGGITGGYAITLTRDPGGLSSDIRHKFPHLANLPVLRLDPDDLALVPEILRGQIAVAATNNGQSVNATGLQIPGVLDDLYTYSGDLGVTWNGNVPTLAVWAPTAKNVTLHVFNDSLTTTTSTTYTMTLDPDYGVWSVTGDATWNNKFYLYEVEVYVHSTGQVEHNLVTDPYSFSLSTNSLRSQIVNLASASLKPAGWDGLTKPELAAFEDISIYELHVRDFSIFDESIPEADRGTFKAFTHVNSHGMQHLLALQQAGLTHLHLLPVFDIATINENKDERVEPDYDVLAGFGPASDQQQALIDAIRDQDGFNWGYDPFHFTVPEGSYSTNPDGTTRIVEFREMVQTLNENGLFLVIDVVYNHTNASGQGDKSVFDRIVPGYYHRLNANGAVEKSTCCENTASEHAMFEKFMIDSLVTWAKEYKVDAFRFDLMGHHMITNMVNIRLALDELTIENDGVDGSQIYIYGEGWNFGEVANNARGINATQLNVGGLGIGTFSDRLRDAVRGPGPFNGGDSLQEQGFANGLFYDPNPWQASVSTPTDQRNRLLLLTDQIKVGLAGNLAAYELVDRTGNTVMGSQVDYNGQPAGYTEDPQEVITYISKHDNQTLFDINAYTAPTMTTTMADRIRIQQVGLSVVSLGQGIPFYHAGVDMLRSKSLDRDSYNSGDWFNRLDFTYQTNNWGAGLPMQGVNGTNWYLMQPLLVNPAMKPAPSDIEYSADLFREWLEIRYSSRLFRLTTAEDVMDRVTFFNDGPSQIEGLIVMHLDDAGAGLADLDPNHEQILVLFNANDQAQTFTLASVAGAAWALHPTQQASVDAVVRTAAVNSTTGAFTVPGRTTAVFIVPQTVEPPPPPTAPNLSGSTKSASVATALMGDTIAYTLVISNSGDAVANAIITDTLPSGVTVIGTLPAGMVQVGNQLRWSGTVAAGQQVSLVYAVRVNNGVVNVNLVNSAVINDGRGNTFTRTATVAVGKPRIYLPVVFR